MSATRLDREARVSRALVVASTIAIALAAVFELFGPPANGHYASSASVGIIAENMHRWRIAGPVWDYVATRPTPDRYYVNHPWGIFWTTWVFYEIFGRHDFVLRLAPALLSIATPPLLAALGRALWRPFAGAVAAVAFVVLPITLSFASFNALEVPVIAWSTLFLWGWVRDRQAPSRRHLAAMLVGAVMACNADWPAFVLVFSVLGAEALVFVADLVARRRLDRRRLRACAAVALASLAVLAFYVVELHRIGKLGQLRGAYALRAAGNHAPLADVLKARAYWIDLMFSPVAIALGKAFVVVGAVRLLVVRRVVEIVPFAVLAMAVVQYVVFREGADVHVFWPQYFAPYFALAMAGLVATAASLLARVARLRTRDVGLAALVLALVPLVPIARQAIPTFLYARATGGRFDEHGHAIESAADAMAALRWFVAQPELAAGTEPIRLHGSLRATWSHEWALGGRPIERVAFAPPADAAGFTIADARLLDDRTRAAWLAGYSVTAVDHVWFLRPGHAPPRAFAIEEREPSALEAYFVSGTEPHREIVEDPWATWELAVHYADRGATPSPPTTPPRTRSQHRVRYDAAVLAGDEPTRLAERDALLRGCARLDARFSDGTTILAACLAEGVAPKLTLLVEAARPSSEDTALVVRSRVVEPPPGTMPLDPQVRTISFPPALSPARWRRGFVYEVPVWIRARPGVEVFTASFVGRSAPWTNAPVEVLRR